MLTQGRKNKNNEKKKTISPQNVLRFWLAKGVDGFRMDAIPHLFEVEDLRDEPLSGSTNDPRSYEYTQHVYTKGQPETYDMVSQWRAVLDEYEDEGNPRVMMIEAYDSLDKTMDYYLHGAHFPFNFALIMSVNRNSGAGDFKNVIDNWMTNLPTGAVSNWVVRINIALRILSVVWGLPHRTIMLRLRIRLCSLSRSREESMPRLGRVRSSYDVHVQTLYPVALVVL